MSERYHKNDEGKRNSEDLIPDNGSRQEIFTRASKIVQTAGLYRTEPNLFDQSLPEFVNPDSVMPEDLDPPLWTKEELDRFATLEEPEEVLEELDVKAQQMIQKLNKSKDYKLFLPDSDFPLKILQICCHNPVQKGNEWIHTKTLRGITEIRYAWDGASLYQMNVTRNGQDQLLRISGSTQYKQDTRVYSEGWELSLDEDETPKRLITTDPGFEGCAINWGFNHVGDKQVMLEPEPHLYQLSHKDQSLPRDIVSYPNANVRGVSIPEKLDPDQHNRRQISFIDSTLNFYNLKSILNGMNSSEPILIPQKLVDGSDRNITLDTLLTIGSPPVKWKGMQFISYLKQDNNSRTTRCLRSGFASSKLQYQLHLRFPEIPESEFVGILKNHHLEDELDYARGIMFTLHDYAGRIIHLQTCEVDDKSSHTKEILKMANQHLNSQSK